MSNLSMDRTTPPVKTHPAPAHEENGTPVWTVWVDREMNCIATCYSFEACMIVANALALTGRLVVTNAI